jgi:phage gpG-like protein
LDQHGEFNALKDGSVFADDGYSNLTAQFTVLNINQTSIRETVETSAAIASPGGTWSGVVDANPGDPEGEGIIPRRFINTTLLQTDPQDILDIIDEIIQTELNI